MKARKERVKKRRWKEEGEEVVEGGQSREEVEEEGERRWREEWSPCGINDRKKKKETVKKCRDNKWGEVRVWVRAYEWRACHNDDAFTIRGKALEQRYYVVGEC